MRTLYIQRDHGLYEWTISWDSIAGKIKVSYGAEHGAKSESIEYVTAGKSGRNLAEQVRHRVITRASKQLGKGYKTSRIEAITNPSNKLGLPKPMLAQPYVGPSPSIELSLTGTDILQYKILGRRCMIAHAKHATRVWLKISESKPIVAYDSNSNIVTEIPHVTESLRHILPEGCTIDGVLIPHEIPYEDLKRLFGRAGNACYRALKFVAFDVVLDEPYEVRYQTLQNMLENFSHDFVEVIANYPYISDKSMKTVHAKALREGYEGLMLRRKGCKYESGARSTKLLEIKSPVSQDFVVSDIVPSADSWAVLSCTASDGRSFIVPAPGSLHYKRSLLTNSRQYIGRRIEIMCVGMDDGGIPIHPVVTDWV